MKQFILTKNKSYSFSSCETCNANCCNGSMGTLYSQIILEDFENFENFPILFTFGNLNFAKPVILLTNGENFCRHLKDMKCSIYENRPQICKNYPLSPNIDEQTYIDVTCPSVHENSNDENSFVKEKEMEDYFKNYKDLYINTYFEFEKFKKEDYTKVLTIRNIDFFAYLKEDDNKYIKMHQNSLTHLEDEYFNNLK